MEFAVSIITLLPSLVGASQAALSTGLSETHGAQAGVSQVTSESEAMATAESLLIASPLYDHL